MSGAFNLKAIPRQCRPDGPFEFIEYFQPEGGVVRIRARCKRCGRVFDRSRTFFYEARNKSCGCAHYGPVSAVTRAKMSASQLKPRECLLCGEKFIGGANAKYCPDCRGKRKSIYFRDYNRRRNGWTEEEIRLGHRINN